MHWVAPSEKDTASATLEKRFWDAADQFRANSGLKAQEYSVDGPPGPVLGLIFLRFDAKLAQLESPSPLGGLGGERAGVRGDLGHPRPSDGRGAGGEGCSSDPSKETLYPRVETTDETVRLCRSHVAFAN